MQSATFILSFTNYYCSLWATTGVTKKINSPKSFDNLNMKKIASQYAGSMRSPTKYAFSQK